MANVGFGTSTNGFEQRVPLNLRGKVAYGELIDLDIVVILEKTFRLLLLASTISSLKLNKEYIIIKRGAGL